MLKVRITAIRQTIYNDLIAQYENPIEHACDIQQGQQWISVNGNCPDGLCPSAWDSMKPFVESLAHGKGNFFDGWMKNPMSAIISCNDGFRPFSFYIEAIEEESQAAHEQSENQPQSGTEKTCSLPQPRLIPKDKEEARVYKLVLVLGKQARSLLTWVCVNRAATPLSTTISAQHGNVASLTTPTLIRLINRNKPTASQQKVLTYTHN